MSSYYASNDYVDQYRGPKIFYKRYVGEELLNAFIKYTDMKSKYPFQVIDLGFQIYHNNPKKIQLFEKYSGATNIARLFMIKKRHTENKMISDGNNITEVNII